MLNRIQTKGQTLARQISDQKSLKRQFRMFFEGYEGYEAVVEIPIHKFGITDIQFNETDTATEMTITLERPGILIGRAGTVINQLKEYLSEHHGAPVKILIIESKLWS